MSVSYFLLTVTSKHIFVPSFLTESWRSYNAFGRIDKLKLVPSLVFLLISLQLAQPTESSTFSIEFPLALAAKPSTRAKTDICSNACPCFAPSA